MLHAQTAYKKDKDTARVQEWCYFHAHFRQTAAIDKVTLAAMCDPELLRH